MMETVHHALMDQAESAWSELQSEYSATAREIREIADRTPAVYDLEGPSLTGERRPGGSREGK